MERSNHMRHGRVGQRGFTLIETVVALAVLLFASAGVFAGLLAASRELRQGQLRQHLAALADASAQRVRLQSKAALLGLAVAPPAAAPPSLAVGAPPWSADASAPVGLDPGTGAYFRVTPDGAISRAVDVLPGTACDSVPPGVSCRETLVTRGPPRDAAVVLASGAQVLTYWVRISRKPAPNGEAESSVVQSEVVAQ